MFRQDTNNLLHTGKYTLYTASYYRYEMQKINVSKSTYTVVEYATLSSHDLNVLMDVECIK